MSSTKEVSKGMQQYFEQIKEMIKSGAIIREVSEHIGVNEKTIASLLKRNNTNVTEIRAEAGLTANRRNAEKDARLDAALDDIRDGMTLIASAEKHNFTVGEIKAYMNTKRIRACDLRGCEPKNKPVHFGGKFHGLYTRDELLEMVSKYPTRKQAFYALKLPGTYHKMLQYLIDAERRELRSGDRLDTADIIPAWRKKVARSSWFGGNLCL